MNASRPTPALMHRLVTIQVGLIVVMGLTMVAIAMLVGPSLFHHHMAQAGHGQDSAAVAHAETAFRQAGGLALLWGILLGGGVALAFSVLLARRVSAALSALSQAAQRVAAGEYALTLPAAGVSREVESLAAGFTQMASQLASIESSRRRLITDVAHEMRTPLAALTAVVEGLEDGVVAPDAATWTTLRAQTSRLARLAGDLSEVSAAEEGRLLLHRARCDLGEIVGAAVRDRVGRTSVALQLEPNPQPVWAWVDRERIGQVVGNVVDNAIRHTPVEGQVGVQLTASQDQATITISDTGVGIAAQHLPHLFERFYRTDTARDRQHGGSGVGLTISAAIVQAHQGQIRAHSAGIGQGATFTIMLPLEGALPEDEQQSS